MQTSSYAGPVNIFEKIILSMILTRRHGNYSRLVIVKCLVKKRLNKKIKKYKTVTCHVYVKVGMVRCSICLISHIKASVITVPVIRCVIR